MQKHLKIAAAGLLATSNAFQISEAPVNSLIQTENNVEGLAEICFSSACAAAKTEAVMGGMLADVVDLKAESIEAIEQLRKEINESGAELISGMAQSSKRQVEDSLQER